MRLYPVNIADDSMKREQTILAIINETTSSDYKVNIWPKIMSISRIPDLVEQILPSNEHERLLLAIEKLQFRFELQPHRFLIHQLVPASTTCFVCHNRLEEPKFDEISSIITRDNVYSCVMYKIDCCDLVYKYGHVRNRRTRERFVTPDAIFNQKFLHLFDHIVYERRLVVAFTNLVYEAATNFQSYTNATNSDIDQNRNLNGESAINNKLNSKCFSVTWTWFEICRYLFFMTDLTMVQVPDVIQRLSHDLYYEVNAPFFYELFVKFWSRHDQVQGCKCQSKDQCMLNFVFDTHMKAHRLKAIELDQIAEDFYDNDICTVHRDNDDREHKRRTAGFMAVVSNCNVIIGWGESVRSEGMRRWIYQLLKMLHLQGKLPPAAAYDSACTFVAYLKSQYGLSIKSSIYVDELIHKKYCIDRFHRRNHVRPECKTILSCEYKENKPYFENQNTQVCEQLFAHYTKIKSTLRSITWPYSNIFYCIIFHLRNCLHTKIYPDNPYLAKKSNIQPPINILYPWTQVMVSSVGALSEDEAEQQSDEENQDNADNNT
ncbi:unnamed protein product [Rotaria sp. Silwood1]|nr:unnamed protein product [Rotaria sp. Silwood1]